VIAAINGHCVGGGLEIALACEICGFARANAGKLGLPEVSAWRASPGPAAHTVWDCGRRAKAIELDGGRHDVRVDEAKALGLINAVLTRPREFRARA